MIFNKDYLDRAIIIKIAWWKRMLLFFRPTVIGYDVGSADIETCIFTKELFGTIYVVGESQN